MVKIILDPGHGGHDGGAQGNGLSEKELTLAIAKAAKALLNEYEGAEVELTREDDRFLDLSARAKLANQRGAAVFVSIHINSSTGTNGDGFETYIYNGPIQPKTAAFQNVLHRAIMNTGVFTRDRGQKKANFAVLRDSGMSAVLTENGFINNPGNAKILKDPAAISKIAKGHADGIAQFLGLTKAKEKAPASTPAAAGTIYKVQIGAYSDRANADKQAAKAKAAGFNVFIVEEKE